MESVLVFFQDDIVNVPLPKGTSFTRSDAYFYGSRWVYWKYEKGLSDGEAEQRAEADLFHRLYPGFKSPEAKA